MSPRTAAAAAVRTAASTVHAPARTRVPQRPAPARRRSGAKARPRTQIAAPRLDFVGLLDRLLRGPAYIAVVGILLAGIVFFNVDVLELNHGIANTDIKATQLKRDNAALMLQLARLGSSERIQRVALQHGLVLPQPGDVRYLHVHPRADAGRALRVMTAPDSSSVATAVPSVVVQQSSPTPGTTSAATTTTSPSTTTTTTPTTTATPAPATSTTPAQTTPSTTAPVGTTTPAGATAAPATTAQTTP